MLGIVAGILGAVVAVLDIGELWPPTNYISQLMMCVYCTYFGLLILMFELSNSPKVNKYFRENLGFYMTLGGRATFLFSMGLFALGAGGTSGYLAGACLIFDGMFHLYVVRRNPGIRAALREQDRARLKGETQGDDSGMITRVANMAVEDPNKLKSTAVAGANLAQSNPGLATAAMGMAAGGGTFGSTPAPAPVQAPAPTPVPVSAPPSGTEFQVDDYDLGDDGGTAI